MQSVQKEPIGIILSVDERILPWCLHKVGELQPPTRRSSRLELYKWS